MTLYHCRKCGAKFVGTLMSERCDCGNSEFGFPYSFAKKPSKRPTSIAILDENEIGLDDGILWVFDEEGI